MSTLHAAPAQRIDLARQRKDLYVPPAKAPVLVDVPEFQFLMLDGAGDPNTSPAYQEAISALYGLAYPLKFAIRAATGRDYPVLPLEGLWWVDGGGEPFAVDRSTWRWTMMIRVPDEATPELIAEARAKAAKKVPVEMLARLRVERFREGQAAQIMYVGPYAAERPTIERLHAFVAERGLAPVGKHHEIYLGDPRRTAAEKLRTVLRHPVRPT
jgi:hypothetical protein